MLFINDQSITALAEKVDEVLSLSIEERTKLGEKAQQFILDTKNATIQCTKILELIKKHEYFYRKSPINHGRDGIVR